MCSHCDGHPDEEKFVREFNARKVQPSEDSFGQDLLQSYLAAVHASYMRRESLRNLIGHIYGSSPLVGVHKL